MARRGFTSTRRGFALRLSDVEFEGLQTLLVQLAELVDAEGAQSDDPLEAMVGIGTADTPPTDPALARLLPDAYRDDPAAAADFRRYTEQQLRREKAQRSRSALRTLDRAGQGKVELSAQEADDWLRCLNDLRLVIAVRLGIDTGIDTDDAEVPEDDLYDWLTWLQASLVDALMGG